MNNAFSLTFYHGGGVLGTVLIYIITMCLGVGRTIQHKQHLVFFCFVWTLFLSHVVMTTHAEQIIWIRTIDTLYFR